MGKNIDSEIEEPSEEVQGEFYEDEGACRLFDNKYCPKCYYYFKNKNLSLDEKWENYWKGFREKKYKHKVLFGDTS